MIGTAIKNLGVQIRRGMGRESTKEVFEKLGLQVTNVHDVYLVVIDEGRTASKIDRDYGQCFVHRLDEIAGAIDSAPIT